MWENGGDQGDGGGELVEDGDVAICGDRVEKLERLDAGKTVRWEDVIYI